MELIRNNVLLDNRFNTTDNFIFPWLIYYFEKHYPKKAISINNKGDFQVLNFPRIGVHLQINGKITFEFYSSSKYGPVIQEFKKLKVDHLPVDHRSFIMTELNIYLKKQNDLKINTENALVLFEKYRNIIDFYYENT